MERKPLARCDEPGKVDLPDRLVELLGRHGLSGTARSFDGAEHVVHAQLRVSAGEVKHRSAVGEPVTRNRLTDGEIIVHLVLEVGFLIMSRQIKTRALAEGAVDPEVTPVA